MIHDGEVVCNLEHVLNKLNIIGYLRRFRHKFVVVWGILNLKRWNIGRAEGRKQDRYWLYHLGDMGCIDLALKFSQCEVYASPNRIPGP